MSFFFSNLDLDMTETFLPFAIQQFKYYQSLGDKTFAQLTDEQLFYQSNADSNSIYTIVKHLNGNMLSRWTNFLDSDGEKTWRNRDEEFNPDSLDRAGLLKLWHEGWNCLFGTLNTLTPNDLEKIVTIRGEKHTVESAIVRQLAHYPYHVGQIVFIGKMLSQNPWQSLSIPRNKSADFNAQMQAKQNG